LVESIANNQVGKKTKNHEKSGDFLSGEKSKNQESPGQIRRFGKPGIYAYAYFM
jgi:hypothetical protein